MIVYLAGPMRGYDQFNFPAFDKATKQLRDLGYSVFSPAEKDRESGFHPEENSLDGFDLQAAMRADLQFIVNSAEGIVLMPGWEKSKGVAVEKLVAETIGLQVIPLEEALSVRR